MIVSPALSGTVPRTHAFERRALRITVVPGLQSKLDAEGIYTAEEVDALVLVALVRILPKSISDSPLNPITVLR